MVDTKVTMESPVREQVASVSISQRIPRVVRCRSCQKMARETGRQQVSNDETVVVFECDYCCHHETRHYFDTQLGL